MIVEEDGEGAETGAGAMASDKVNNFYETQDIRKQSASHSRSPSKGSYQAKKASFAEMKNKKLNKFYGKRNSRGTPGRTAIGDDEDRTASPEPFFNQRNKRYLSGTAGVDSLNVIVRNREINRILNENEAMLKRLQNRQSNYNVWSWENERKQQVKRIK